MIETVSHIYNFWQYTSANINFINVNEIYTDLPKLKEIKEIGGDFESIRDEISPSAYIFIKLQDLLEKVDPDITVMMHVDILHTPNIKIPNSDVPVCIAKFNLEFSASGDINKFRLLYAICRAADAFPIPSTWSIIKFYTPIKDPSKCVLIEYMPERAISIGAMRYVLRAVSSFPDYIQRALLSNNNDVQDICTLAGYEYSVDKIYHLMIIIENDIAMEIPDNGIEFMRNSVWKWLERIIGEFHTVINIAQLVILPERGFDEVCASDISLRAKVRNGVHLVGDLIRISTWNNCAVCGTGAAHCYIQHVDNDFDEQYAGIEPGYYCKFCLDLHQRAYKL